MFGISKKGGETARTGGAAETAAQQKSLYRSAAELNAQLDQVIPVLDGVLTTLGEATVPTVGQAGPTTLRDLVQLCEGKAETVRTQVERIEAAVGVVEFHATLPDGKDLRIMQPYSGGPLSEG